MVHTIAGAWAQTGGPSVSVPNLCTTLGLRGIDVTLLMGRGELSESARSFSERGDLEQVRLGPYWLANTGPWFGRRLRQLAIKAGVIHGHGLWLQPNWSTAINAARLKRPFVLSPRGMLEPAALRRRGKLKRVLWSAIQRRCVKAASVIHATSEKEAQSIQLLELDRPLAIIPNGVGLDSEFAIDRVRMLAAGMHAERPRRILFLGRVHAHKGIPDLLRAWSDLQPRKGTAELVVAGWCEERDWLNLVAEAGLAGNPTVRFVGPVFGEEKARLLCRSWALVMPSKSENYGLVAAEALACMTPVIATQGTPWASLPEDGCGWSVRADSSSLREAIGEALDLSEETRALMGGLCRRAAERDHSLEASADSMIALYRWVSGAGPQPSCVIDIGEPRRSSPGGLA